MQRNKATGTGPKASKGGGSNGKTEAPNNSRQQPERQAFVPRVKPPGTRHPSRRFWCFMVLLFVGLFLLLILANYHGASNADDIDDDQGIEAQDFSERAAPTEDFAREVVPIIRSFVAKKYKAYGEGSVTLRHMKEHIVRKSKLGLSYDDLRDDRYSLIIEHEVDAIVKRCDGGKKHVACVKEA